MTVPSVSRLIVAAALLAAISACSTATFLPHTRDHPPALAGNTHGTGLTLANVLAIPLPPTSDTTMAVAPGSRTTRLPTPP